MMAKIYEIDFAALSSEEKSKFILNLKDLAEECFAASPFEVTINAQLLMFTRWWNSYRLMAPEIRRQRFWISLWRNCGIIRREK